MTRGWLKPLHWRDGLKLHAVSLLQLFEGRSHQLAEKLIQGTVIQVDDLSFELVDLDCFDVLAPYWESFMEQWFKPQVAEVYLDIGAHIGKYVLPAARIVGEKGRVIAVEPLPLIYHALKKNIERNRFPNVVTLNVAAWDSDTQLKLYLSSRLTTSTAFPGEGSSRNRGSVMVIARIMDEIIEELDLDRLNWIKIDVEGAECQALQGLRQTIRTYKPRIIVEVYAEHEEWIREFMQQHFYKTETMAPPNLGPVYLYCEPMTDASQDTDAQS